MNPIWKNEVFELTNGMYLQKQNGYTNEVFQMENILSGQRGNNQKTKEEDAKDIPSVCVFLSSISCRRVKLLKINRVK